MTREELFSDIRASRPADDDLVYIERRGAAYNWNRTGLGGEAADFNSEIVSQPDVWIYYSGAWPAEDGDRLRAFFDDLLDEMESMAGGDDRCRWPVDEPWPHRH